MTATIEPKTIPTSMHQALAMAAAQPHVALVTGLGGGKTWTGARWILLRALDHPESIHLVTANSYPQAQDVVIPALDEAAEDLGLNFRWIAKRTTPSMFVRVGGREVEIRIRSSLNYDRLRGAEYGSWWADEVRDAPKRSIPVILGRLRCRHVDRPSYLWTTTPNGHDFLWKRHAEGATVDVERDPVSGFPVRVFEHPNRDRLLIQADTRVNVHLASEYADLLEEAMDAQTLAQERGGEFVALGNRVYHAFVWEQNVRTRAAYSSKQALDVCLDFNPHKMAAVMVQERAGKTLVVGELSVERGGTPAVIEEFRKRYPERADGEGVTIYGDPAGYHPDTREGVTDFLLWAEAMPDVQIRVPRAAGRVRDRVNATNARLCNGRGEVGLLIHPDCRETITDLEAVIWSEKNFNDIDKRDGDRTHHSDALSYRIAVTHPIRRKIDLARERAEVRRLSL